MIGTQSPPIFAEPAGFWRRLLALAVDIAFVVIVGRGLGLFWFDTLASLGQHGLALGACVLLGYFGLLGSRLGGGATFGKRAFSLRLVDGNGDLLDPGPSIARAAVIVVPWVVVQLSVPPGLLATVHAWLAWAAVGLLGWSVYLFFFNTPLRRSLPDLLADSAVVCVSSDARAVDMPEPSTLWRGHVVVGVIAMCCLLGGRSMLPTPTLDDRDDERIAAVRAALQAELGTVRVGTHLGYALSWHVAAMPGFGDEAASATSRYVTVTVGLSREPKSFDDVVDRIATTLLLHFPEAFDRDSIEIVVLYGFDIGIAENWTGRTIGLDPSEWRERIGARSLPA